MSTLTRRTGTVSFTPPSLDVECHTWFLIIGNLSSESRPLVAAHGGPGANHEYLLSGLADIPRLSGQPLIVYDQIGNGKSTHLTDQPDKESLWTIALFTAELDNLLNKLGVEEFDFIGHSWGGVIGLEYALSKATKMKRLILSSTPAYMTSWTDNIKKSLNELDNSERVLALELDASGSWMDPRLLEIQRKIQELHICRITPWPQVVLNFFATVAANPTVYMTMFGLSQFRILGTLKDWSVVGRCQEIKLPTLVIHGEYDYADKEAVRPLVEEIEGSQLITMKGCSHFTQVEDPDAYTQHILAFLKSH